ncbi:MAG: hypothetical protein IT452_23240 [Planctomycetia bacterium]|nr:hypothetical protein [Planctomycetia bacterium]
MRKMLAVAAVASCALLLYAEDSAAEYEKRAKKLENEEGLSHVSLGKHCENTKMWKEAVEEWSRVAEIFPDNKEATEHLAKAQERADVVVSRPSEKDAATYATGLATMKKTMAKKWRDLAAWATSKGLESEAADAVARAEEFESAKKTTGTGKQGAVDWLNGERRKCKLPPVELGDELTDGAQKHAEYLVKNDAHPSTKGLGAHREDENLPGYTPEGARAGMQSDIGRSAPPQAMKGMLGTFYHRMPLLHPDLRKVGIGYATVSGGNGEGEGAGEGRGRGGRWGGGGGWGRGWCVIDYSGKGERDEKAPRVVAYPPDKATSVQLHFAGEEPDPIPPGEDPECGMPVTLGFVDGERVTNAAVVLTAGGVTVDGYLSSPEKPARADFPNEGICFIPKDPLSANTKYHVKVTAKVNDEDFVKEWDFTTGK